MNDIEITRHGAFHIATAQGKTCFVAWGKMGPIQAQDPIREPGNHVWVNYEATREEARRNLLGEFGLSE